MKLINNKDKIKVNLKMKFNLQKILYIIQTLIENENLTYLI